MTAAGIGLDIGATKTLGVLTDELGQVQAQVRVATRPGADGVLATAVDVVTQLRGRTTAQLWPIGIGVPGLVDVDLGVVRHAVNLDLDGSSLPLAAELESRLGLPVLLENDVNAASIGATALLPHGVRRDLAYLSIGTGFAAALVLDGHLRRGAHGAAGEIGHVPIDPNGLLCACGLRGCLETVASGAALAQAWPGADGVPAAVGVFDAAATGDQRAVEVRNRFAAAVAAGVRLLCLTVDVEVVVIGGGVAQVGEPLRVAVADALRAQAGSSEFLASLELAERLTLVPADYPVAAIGAALLGRPA
jgi:glucokinase